MNIESVVIAYLNSALTPPVYADAPTGQEAPYIVLERTGGASGSHVIDRPTIVIQCYGETRLSSSEMAYLVEETMLGITSNPAIKSVTKNSLYNFPDSDGKPRYQVVFDIVVNN